MAWMAIEFDTPDKPEILRMAAALRKSPEEILGCVILVWIWVQQHTPDGRVHLGTLEMVDRAARRSGFGQAMVDAEWIVFEKDVMVFPNWDRHNSQNAKARKLDSERKKSGRQPDKSRKVSGSIPENVQEMSCSKPDNGRTTLQNITVQKNTTTTNLETPAGRGGGGGVITHDVVERAAWFKRRPDWLPDGKPWLDAEACQRLALRCPGAKDVERVYREAKDKRNVLKNPAGYVLTKLESMS